MPMPPQVGGIGRNGDHVTESDADVAVATRADVDLGCLVGLDESGFGVRMIARIGAPFGALALGYLPFGFLRTSHAASIATLLQISARSSLAP